MSLYNYPTNITNATSLLSYGNSVTDGWMMTLVAFAIFCVAFFSLKVYSTARAFAGASFIAFVVVTIFRVLNLVSDLTLAISGLCLIVAVVFLIAGEKA
jgi:predicted membrane channel-forming protein YqfA (hemolysin III family)